MGALFLLGAIVVVDQVGVGAHAVATVTLEAVATLVTGLGGVVDLLVVSGGVTQNAVGGLAGGQVGLGTTVTTDTCGATLTCVNSGGDGGVSSVGQCTLLTCGTFCTISGTTGGTDDGVHVALCTGRPQATCVNCASLSVLQVVVSATGVHEASATAATCNCNGGTVDNQSGGATTGCGVDDALQAGVLRPNSVDALHNACGDGGGQVGGTAVTVALATLCGGQGAVTDTTGCANELNGLAGLDLDDTGDLSTGTCCHIGVVGTTGTADDLELNLVDSLGNNERSGALSTRSVTVSAVSSGGSPLAFGGGSESRNNGRSRDNRSSPCCARNNLAARNVSRHICPSRVMSFEE